MKTLKKLFEKCYELDKNYEYNVYYNAIYLTFNLEQEQVKQSLGEQLAQLEIDYKKFINSCRFKENDNIITFTISLNEKAQKNILRHTK